jgi:hypothetical protein
MRIAQVAPLYESVPPKLYGGTERIVSYLTEELVRSGHDVTLFASGDSVTSARLAAPCARALRLDPGVRDAIPHHVIMLEELRQRADEFDVIHFHIDLVQMPLARALGGRTVTTLHGRLDLPDLQSFYRAFSTPPFVMLAAAYHKRTGDLGTIREIWPNVRAALGWMEEHGDRDGDGFLAYAQDRGRPRQPGLEGQPRQHLPGRRPPCQGADRARRGAGLCLRRPPRGRGHGRRAWRGRDGAPARGGGRGLRDRFYGQRAYRAGARPLRLQGGDGAHLRRPLPRLDLHRPAPAARAFLRLRPQPRPGPDLLPGRLQPAGLCGGRDDCAHLGLTFDVANNRVALEEPVLPPVLDEIHLRNLRLGAGSLDICVRRAGAGVTTAAVRREGDLGLLVAS